MLANRVLSESVCRLFPLVLSDLIDEDTAKFQRVCYTYKHTLLWQFHVSRYNVAYLLQDKTLSASVVGSATFVSKFGQSLAPIITFYLLPELRDMNHVISSHFQEQVWTMLLTVPAVCVVIQFTLWTFCYQLLGNYLSKIKRSSSAEAD